MLTSSVVRFATPGAVPRLDLKAIKIPVLLYHHAKDACKHCQASETPFIIKGLSNAPIKKLMVVDGGTNPSAMYARVSTGMDSSAWSVKQ